MLLLLQGFWSNDNVVMSVPISAILNMCDRADLSVSSEIWMS